MTKAFVDEFINYMKLGNTVTKVAPWSVEGMGEKTMNVRYVGLRLSDDWLDVFSNRDNILLKFVYTKNMVKPLVIEFIGTFFLVLVVALTGNPLAIGAVLTALVYMGGHISGAQYNPAVTLALLLNNKLSLGLALRYMLVQLLASITAALAYFFIVGSVFIPQLGVDVSATSAILIEILFTFLLVTVILHVAVSDRTKNNHYFGIAIGFTLLAIAFAGGPISGGVFNPAVGLGPLLVDFGNLSGAFGNLLIYLFGPFIGGALAGLVYKALE